MTEPQIEVRCIDYMGDDRTVAMAAWSSTDKWQEALICPEENVVRLLNALVRGRHAPPFGHPHLMLFIVAPLVIWTQILRHRSWASFSVLSFRYVWGNIRTYMPERMRVPVDPSKPMGYRYKPMAWLPNRLCLWTLRLGYGLSLWTYVVLHKLGASNELARLILPGGTITRGFATVSLRNALNFLVLRQDEHAQQEIREVASEIHAILVEHFPITMGLWEKHGRPQL